MIVTRRWLVAVVCGIAFPIAVVEVVDVVARNHEPFVPLVDAGDHDSHADAPALGSLKEIMRPGLECLRRETAATRARTDRLREREVELRSQIDVMSGAYALRRKLANEPNDEAIKHALRVLRDDAIAQQSVVARKFLADNDAIVDSGFDPTEDERMEHEMIVAGQMAPDVAQEGGPGAR